MRIVYSDAELTRLSNDFIVYERNHVVGFVARKCVGQAGCVRRYEELSRPNRDREMEVTLIHSIRHYNGAVTGQECVKRLEVNNSPYEAIEVVPDKLAVD